MAPGPIRRKSKRWRRDITGAAVAAIFWGSVVAKTKMTPGGGSSRIFKSAFHASRRAASNLSARHLIALGSSGRAVTVEKTLQVGAPVDRVWELWSNFESFPRFMAHLREVRKIEEGRSHWVAIGPAGVPAEWEAVVTDWVPGQFLGWRSVEGSPIENSGQVRLRPVSDRETQIDVQRTYTPPAGAAGHALAALLGADPKQAMDDDLLRLKSLLEDEQVSVRAETIQLQ